MSMRNAALLTAMLLTGCASLRAANDTASLEARARAFMASYETELRTHDRAALGRRYHADGAWFLGDGFKDHEAHADIARRYRDEWNGPKHFAWRELTYLPLPPDAVLVLGKFEWQAADAAAPTTYSYSGLLRDGPGGLVIAVEDESREGG
jgi:hypothetical protein